LGVMAGLLLVFVVEWVDDTYPDLQALEQDLRLPLLGLIPWVKTRGESLLVGRGAPRSLVEAMRSLRSNMQFAAADQPLTSLLVTSSMPNEGKTTIAGNLALAAAEAGQRVVLIDADLRRPSVGKLLGTPAEPGLSNLLVGQLDLAKCLHTHGSADAGPAIEVIPAGPLPPNPPALLESERMTSLLEDLRSHADLVIIDAPPVGHFSDGQILGAKVSGVLMVVDPGQTRRGVVRGAQRLLQIAEAPVLGIVCNKVRREGLGGYYYYGSRYYYYYHSYYHRYYGEKSDADRSPQSPA